MTNIYYNVTMKFSVEYIILFEKKLIPILKNKYSSNTIYKIKVSKCSRIFIYMFYYISSLCNI